MVSIFLETSVNTNPSKLLELGKQLKQSPPIGRLLHFFAHPFQNRIENINSTGRAVVPTLLIVDKRYEDMFPVQGAMRAVMFGNFPKVPEIVAGCGAYHQVAGPAAAEQLFDLHESIGVFTVEGGIQSLPVIQRLIQGAKAEGVTGNRLIGQPSFVNDPCLAIFGGHPEVALIAPPGKEIHFGTCQKRLEDFAAHCGFYVIAFQDFIVVFQNMNTTEGIAGDHDGSIRV